MVVEDRKGFGSLPARNVECFAGGFVTPVGVSVKEPRILCLGSMTSPVGSFVTSRSKVCVRNESQTT